MPAWSKPGFRDSSFGALEIKLRGAIICREIALRVSIVDDSLGETSNNLKVQSDTNSRLTLAQTLTLLAGDLDFNHLTCKRRCVPMISTFGIFLYH